MKRLLLALLIAGCCAAQAQMVPGISNPMLTHVTSSGGGGCTGTNVTTITATGNNSFVSPTSCPITFKVFGGGAHGGGSGANFGGGAPGAGSCVITLTPGNGTMVHYTVGAGSAAGTGGGNTGGTSWVNISANSQPGSAAAGCFVVGSTYADDGSTVTGSTGTFGTDFTGGSSVATGNGGGGGGAGSTGNGGNASGTTHGTGGSPDGGNGSDGTGVGSSSNASQPGGGSGAAGNGTAGAGGNGQLIYSY